MTYQLIHGDARHVSDMLEPESVDLIVTSPPYFALRSYRDGGEHYDGQIGSEPTPGEFIDALIACTRDWLTVLKPSGSLFVNLGDKYAGSGGHNNNSGISRHGTGSSTLAGGRPDVERRTALAEAIKSTRRNAPDRYNQESDGIRPKSLMGLPWRYAIRCIDELGLILRAEIVWSKPNGLPESVMDRVRRSHEQWFHLTREGSYFAAIDEIRGEHAPGTAARYAAGYGDRSATNDARPTVGYDLGGEWTLNTLGKVPDSVWSIPSEPLTVPPYRIVVDGRNVAHPWTLDEAYKTMCGLGGRPSLRTLPDHFAAFPSEWPRRLILGWSPSGYCTVCDDPRRAVVDKSLEVDPRGAVGTVGSRYTGTGHEHNHQRMGKEVEYGTTVATITGYACACPDTAAPTRPAVVLDPFAGTGTTPAVAHLLGRHGVGIDLSRDYLRLAEWRCTHDTALRNKVLDRSGIPNPKPPTIDGQANLLDLIDAGGAA